MKKNLFLLIAPWMTVAAFAQQPVVGPVASSTMPPSEVGESSVKTTPTSSGSATSLNQPESNADFREIPVARAEPVSARDIATRLQIFLDQNQFGPGKIDGAAGEFTAKALARYQRAKGLPVTTESLDGLPLNEISPIYTTYTITEADAKRVGDVPRKAEEQAKLQRMPYPSLLKFLVERFHSDPNFLQSLNPSLNLEKIGVGDTVWVPNVAPFQIESVRALAKVPLVPEYKSRRILIDTKEKMLELVEGSKLIAAFPITPGSGSLPAPVGTWRIVGIATLPWFRHDEGVLNRGVRTSVFYNVPAGPSNPVGVVWIGLSKPSIGIHGTNNPLTIGRAASHGCIRMANWDVIRLVSMITEGMNVIISDGNEEKSTFSAVSQNPPLTVRADKANKNAPQIPGREMNYANH